MLYASRLALSNRTHPVTGAEVFGTRGSNDDMLKVAPTELAIRLQRQGGDTSRQWSACGRSRVGVCTRMMQVCRHLKNALAITFSSSLISLENFALELKDRSHLKRICELVKHAARARDTIVVSSIIMDGRLLMKERFTDDSW